VQLQAYVRDDLWLRNARHANGAAQMLAPGLEGLPGIGIVEQVQVNMVFLRIDDILAERLKAIGLEFRRRLARPRPRSSCTRCSTCAARSPPSSTSATASCTT
jgi:threonine aldolase